MALVLLLLCAYYTYATWNRQFPSGAETARQLVHQVPAAARGVLVVTQRSIDADAFAQAAREALQSHPAFLGVVQGEPSDLRQHLDQLTAQDKSPDTILATPEAANWLILQNLRTAKVLSPQAYYWSDFLTRSNFAAIGDRIVVIAVIAIGMTMVILTGGIDLSVGSLIALCAIVATWIIRQWLGGEAASNLSVTVACILAIGVCALAGLFNGVMITLFRVPPFIATLAMMLIASGVAYIIAQGQSIYQVPQRIEWLGRGKSLGGIPNTVLLMAALYALAHVVMTRTLLGRYVYAIGGNRKAAFLSGVPVKSVIVSVYVVCAALAGVGGVVEASRLVSGAPTYGLMAELYVIAAVVVGGTSLSGGRGTIVGTLVGAFIIAVIENGMNLTGVESYKQKVVLGAVILAAVLLDSLRNRHRDAAGE
jgi:ribose transport system permease protein